MKFHNGLARTGTKLNYSCSKAEDNDLRMCKSLKHINTQSRVQAMALNCQKQPSTGVKGTPPPIYTPLNVDGEACGVQLHPSHA